MFYYFFIKPLAFAIKWIFKGVVYLMCYMIGFIFALILFPYYLIFKICGGKLHNPKKERKENDSWRRRFEWAAGYLWH